MAYQAAANEIVKKSISSAVFIDEKARTLFMKESELRGYNEEHLSVELYENFKKDGISLTIHQFTVDDVQNNIIKNYLFKARDLVLLDWKLDGEGGEDYSLQLLSDIVVEPQIHFCSIYTSQAELDNVFWNILSYFSNGTKEEYLEIKDELDDLEEKITTLIPKIKEISSKRFDKSYRHDFAKFCKENKEIVDRIIEAKVDPDKMCAVIKVGIAFGSEETADIQLQCPSLISNDKRTLTIGNTIITILNKKDNKPKQLIESFVNQITSDEKSYFQLLGLEMQEALKNKTAFIDDSILNISRDALIYHRDQKKDEGFNEFIKEVLFEQARLTIRGKKFKLLDDGLLDSLKANAKPLKDDKELQNINTFYNSTILEGDRPLNFGDVFQCGTRYFLCITALCDCLQPKKNLFYFAEGKIIKPNKALPLGDTAFISYLPNKIVQWSDDQRSENANLKPVYIKPLSFTIPNKNIKENKLKFISLSDDGQREEFELEYITTIKQNYTQRIANHAFTHPVRVGVDFVRKN